MKIDVVSVNHEMVLGQIVENFYFDNDVWVGVTSVDHTWEFQRGEDEDSYLNGSYVVDGNAVVDYDGCLELPKEVQKALRHQGYKLYI